MYGNISPTPNYFNNVLVEGIFRQRGYLSTAVVQVSTPFKAKPYTYHVPVATAQLFHCIEDNSMLVDHFYIGMLQI